MILRAFKAAQIDFIVSVIYAKDMSVTAGFYLAVLKRYVPADPMFSLSEL